PNNKFESLRLGQTATDSFTYTLRDGQGNTSTATVTITIQGANDAPAAHNDLGQTSEDQPLLISASGLLANDTDPDIGDTAAITAVNGSSAAVGNQITLPSSALLTVQANGGYRYDPHGKFDYLRAGQTATDTFTYTMADGAGASSVASVTI